MSRKRTRIDLIVSEKFSISRSRAQALILSGKVLISKDGVNFEKITRPSTALEEGVFIKILEREPVSRGYYKIRDAYRYFESRVGSNFVSEGDSGIQASVVEGRENSTLIKLYSPGGKICADIGSSTGGFVQFLLEKGARLVYAVDVGKGLLHYSLRENPRVVVMEGVNARYLTAEDFTEGFPELVTCDVSFISSLKIIPHLVDSILRSSAGGTYWETREVKVVLLVKPQFEIDMSERKFLKKGVLRDESLRRKIVERVLDAYRRKGFEVDFCADSSTPGKDGNVETVAFMRKKLVW